MKSLSKEKLARLEGGGSSACRTSLNLLNFAYRSNSYFLYLTAMLLVQVNCGGGIDSTLPT